MVMNIVITFQSLSGVLGVCNIIHYKGEMLVRLSFNPFRGFRCCNMMKPLSGLRSWYLFQSLSGVLGVCNSEAEKIIKQAQKQFQSLSGV